MDIRPDYANVIRNNDVEQVFPEEVNVDEIIIINPGTNIHKRGYRFPRFSRRITLKEFAHLIKQQHGARFVEAIIVSLVAFLVVVITDKTVNLASVTNSKIGWLLPMSMRLANY